MPPATGIHITDLDHFRPQQRDHLLRLKQKVIPSVALRILGENQIDDFFRVLHGVLPAKQTGCPKCFDALGMNS